ncbi:hypothetical protein H7F51_01400 [Novosphingobium flavum]|uniref:Uncharacterized protein n=1 Tax=Novosphingobium flavum TaxID=1778672 RepID=A0A7X1KK57_9SPHN|nr:hypothetical protein [Novosphingobium flavum]MBC2664167.1 hypothetical protein [Novosphingobium flavum]
MIRTFALGCSLAAICASPVNAKIVARDIKILMDASDPSHAADVGKTHEARIYYDDSKIDPVSHRVPILHQQHTPMLIPAHPDAAEMPVGNAWLDLGSKPYRYHMAASPAVRLRPDGKPAWAPYAILFDEDTQRMTIRRQSDGGLELSGKYIVGEEEMSGPQVDWVINGKGAPDGRGQAMTNVLPAVGTGSPSPGLPHAPTPPLKVGKSAKLVALRVDVVVDQVAPEDEGMYKVGQADTARIVYDASAVDPKTHTVSILEEAHLIGGKYHPNRETRASVLDMSQRPYRLTYASSVTHGRPLVVLFEGATQRMAMLARPDFHMLIAGKYVINPEPVPYDVNRPED